MRRKCALCGGRWSVPTQLHRSNQLIPSLAKGPNTRLSGPLPSRSWRWRRGASRVRHFRNVEVWASSAHGSDCRAYLGREVGSHWLRGNEERRRGRREVPPRVRLKPSWLCLQAPWLSLQPNRRGQEVPQERLSAKPLSAKLIKSVSITSRDSHLTTSFSFPETP